MQESSKHFFLVVSVSRYCVYLRTGQQKDSTQGSERLFKWFCILYCAAYSHEIHGNSPEHFLNEQNRPLSRPFLLNFYRP